MEYWRQWAQPIILSTGYCEIVDMQRYDTVVDSLENDNTKANKF